MTDPTAHPRRLLLFHLGFQKTGTTSAQAWLTHNSGALPEIDLRSSGDATKDLRSAGRSYCAAPSAKTEQRLRDALRRHIDRFALGERDLGLISDENILGRTAYDATGDILSWAKRVLPIIEQCVQAAPRPLQTEFLFYTRETGPWLRSMYNQAVKRARVTGSFDRWLAGAPFVVDWDQWRADMQAEVSTPVRFLPMEADLAQQAPIGAALLARLGVDSARIAALAPVRSQNASLSPGALRAMRWINRLPLSDRRILQISEWVERRDQARQ